MYVYTEYNPGISYTVRGDCELLVGVLVYTSFTYVCTRGVLYTCTYKVMSIINILSVASSCSLPQLRKSSTISMKHANDRT